MTRLISGGTKSISGSLTKIQDTSGDQYLFPRVGHRGGAELHRPRRLQYQSAHVISEDALPVDFIRLLRQLPRPRPEDPRGLLPGLLDVKRQIRGA